MVTNVFLPFSHSSIRFVSFFPMSLVPFFSTSKSRSRLPNPNSLNNSSSSKSSSSLFEAPLATFWQWLMKSV